MSRSPPPPDTRLRGDGDHQMAIPGAGAADEDHVALLGQRAAAGEIAHEVALDRRAVELEVVDILGEREFGDGELVPDRARLLLGELGGENIADHALRLMRRFTAVATISSKAAFIHRA
jgi:hypothetical protein